MSNDSLFTESALDDLRSEIGVVYEDMNPTRDRGRRIHGVAPDRGARGARRGVHAFVRATSSGALNIHRPLAWSAEVHFGDLTDTHSIDLVVKTGPARRAGQALRLPSGAQAHVAERGLGRTSGHGERDRDPEPAPVDHRPRPRARAVRPRGTSEEYRASGPRATTTPSTTTGGLVLHEHSPLNPKSVYATSKLAADYLTQALPTPTPSADSSRACSTTTDRVRTGAS